MLMNIFIAGFLLLAAYGLYVIVTGQDPNANLLKDVERLKKKNKSKAAIIYLRSFDAEKIHLSDIPAGWNGKTIPGTMAFHKDVGNIVTDYLSVIGPVHALDRPDKTFRLRPAAANRPELFHVDNDRWQGKILKWLAKAALVVIQLDDSPGLEWEIMQVVKRLPSTKVLLVLPPRQADYEKLRKRTARLFPSPLPVELAASRLLTFKPDWCPWPLETNQGGEFAMWKTLEPIFDQNGFEPPAWRRIFGFGPSETKGTNA